MQYSFTIAKYTPYIKPKYVTREGTTVLYVRYNYNRTKRTLISTGYSIKPEHWDPKKRWIKRACPHYDEIDACLIRITPGYFILFVAIVKHIASTIPSSSHLSLYNSHKPVYLQDKIIMIY